MLQAIREPPAEIRRVAYLSLDEVKKDAALLQSPWTMREESEGCVSVGTVENFTVKLHVSVHSDFSTFVTVFGIAAPNFNSNIESMRLDKHLKQISSLHPCTGVTDANLHKFTQLPTETNTADKYFFHVTYTYTYDGPKSKPCVRSKDCLLLSGNKICTKCKETERTQLMKQKKTEEKQTQPLKPNDLLHTVSKQQLKAALKQTRKAAKNYRKEIEVFKTKLEEKPITINQYMHSSLETAMKDFQPPSELTDLFWKEQCKAFNTKGRTGVKWHPMMIRLALLLHSRGPAAYKTLRETGVLILPGESTLRDYTNYIHPSTGFQPQVLEEIKTAASKLQEN